MVRDCGEAAVGGGGGEWVERVSFLWVVYHKGPLQTAGHVRRGFVYLGWKCGGVSLPLEFKEPKRARGGFLIAWASMVGILDSATRFSSSKKYGNKSSG